MPTIVHITVVGLSTSIYAVPRVMFSLSVEILLSTFKFRLFHSFTYNLLVFTGGYFVFIYFNPFLSNFHKHTHRANFFTVFVNFMRTSAHIYKRLS